MFRTHTGSTVCPDVLPVSEYSLYVSKFDAYKHCSDVVSAYATLSQTLGKKNPFILVGETSLPETKCVGSLTETPSVEGRVLLLGAIPYKSLPPLYQHGPLNIFVSSCENCFNIFLDTLVSGKSMFCSNMITMSEFGKDAALHFFLFDSKSQSSVLAEALSTPALLNKLSSATVLQSDKFYWNSTSKKPGPGRWRWPNAQKKVVAR
ncbi:glycosyltransferase family 4 protein [Pseudomonas sp. B28(2017)]|uniref:glycosyltransferase family 4 protein n=1 Tax=Pseudomonas sp. B28(2017) TaxID=1981730 RepID=UPI00117B5143|nr:glycosyltransferase family 4 protein [Pseudomonas sp. B28(2017)]